MIQSMTGFGRAEKTLNNKTYLVEIKALNGKQLELSLKCPALLKPYEFDIRNRLQAGLLRGTIDCIVTLKQNGASKPVVLNTELLKSYYEQINQLAGELNIGTESVLSSLLRLPEVVQPATEVLNENDFKDFLIVFDEALANINKHRADEGEVLKADLSLRIKNIEEGMEKILALAPQRTTRIQEEIKQLLEQHVGAEQVDNNRMEQELIYYIEKIDIHEEQIRLKQHCEYFTEILQSKSDGKGKKLGFVLQEIGREINTTGSKAYDAAIQKHVVEMKDDLEKAKEQVLNVL